MINVELNNFCRFLYALTLAINANFHLKNSISSGSDASLVSGWAYFIESKPYKEYITKHVSEWDVSHYMVSAMT
jgi:hypothetical protein